MHVALSGSEVAIRVDSEQETERVGQALAALVKPGDVVGLIGTLGAGKTRMTRALAEALGVDPAAIASPTFVLIHEYTATMPVYHFDTYRLSGPDEFAALGPDEYFEGDGVCVVEWADRVLDQLPARAWLITIEPTEAESRQVVVRFPQGSSAAAALSTRLTSV